MTIWGFAGRSLVRKTVVGVSDEVRFAGNCFITCLSYISYLLEEQVESDIVVGNNLGDLALVTSGKYIVVKERFRFFLLFSSLEPM